MALQYTSKSCAELDSLQKKNQISSEGNFDLHLLFMTMTTLLSDNEQAKMLMMVLEKHHINAFIGVCYHAIVKVLTDSKWNHPNQSEK